MAKFRLLFNLIFKPEQFVQNVTEIIVEEDSVKNPSILTQGIYPLARKADIQESVNRQTQNLRQGFTKGIVSTALTILVGTIGGIALRYLFGPPVKSIVYIVQALGAAVILGATIAEVGGDVMTWDGGSIPEQINKLMFHGLYILGTFLFVLSVAWDAS